MSDIISAIHRLPGIRMQTPATEESISKAENKLGLGFAIEYKEYLLSFGAVWSEIIVISGLTEDEDEDFDVVPLTIKMRSYNPEVPLDFYAIEDVGVDGLVIWQNQSGEVYQTLPFHEPMKIFENLSDFLLYQIDFETRS